MNEALKLEVGHKVLEIGAGSGWHASTIAEIVAPNNLPEDKWGHLYTVEIISSLAKFASLNIKKAGYANRITIIHSDGSKGYPEAAPYDRILVTAAAPIIPPPLKKQLKIGGIMVIPLGTSHLFQILFRITKSVKRTFEENLGGVV
ncbi:MAG: protein-L-isoaspartate O-methyltransferase family protein, partial [Promethearchaeota archaeon]